MGFVAPPSAGTSSCEWSLGARSSYRNNASTPNGRGGGRSIMTAGGVSRSAILPSAEVNVSKIRPMTGLARADNLLHKPNGATAVSSSTPARVIESVGYYQSTVQSKIDDIVNEIERLRSETADGDSESRKALEKKHEDLLKVVQNLEGDLADYNLAKEQARSGTSHESIRNSTLEIIRRNENMEKEIDKIFFSRKKAEDETSQMELELKRLHSTVEAKFLENEDDEKVHEYRALVTEFESIIDETKQEEDDTMLMRHKIKMMESDSGQCFHSQYTEQKNHVEEVKKQLEQVESEIQLAQMNEEEAREHLLGKVLGIQCRTKELDLETSRMQSELAVLFEMQKELRSELRMKSCVGAAGAYERLLKKDHEVKRFFEELPETKSKLEEERCRLTSNIEKLRNDIGERKMMTAAELPSKEEMELMKDEVAFTSKQLDANQETMALLQQQKKSRAEELESIGSLEERIGAELKELGKRTIAMRNDIEKFNDASKMQDSADATKDYLGEMSEKYTQQIQLLDTLLKDSAPQYHHKVEQLDSNSDWKEVQDLKSKLRNQVQHIFELQEKVNSSNTSTGYGKVKASCLQNMGKINRYLISQTQ